MTLTKRGRTMLRETQCRFMRLFLFQSREGRHLVQGNPEKAFNNVLDRAIDGLSGWTRRQSPFKDKPDGRVERFHATLEGLMRTWKNDLEKKYCVPLPAHHPTVAWLVGHCASLHDPFVMKRHNQQTHFQRQMARNYLGVIIPIFETVLWKEPRPHVLSSSRRNGVSASGQDATTWPICTSF